MSFDEHVQDVFSTPFASETMLPEQYFPPQSSAHDFVKRLMLAILEDALSCFEKGRHVIASKRPKKITRVARVAHEAEEWFLSEADWLFSFENICGVLGLSAAAIREQLSRNGASYYRRKRPQRVGRHNGMYYHLSEDARKDR